MSAVTRFTKLFDDGVSGPPGLIAWAQSTDVSMLVTSTCGSASAAAHSVLYALAFVCFTFGDVGSSLSQAYLPAFNRGSLTDEHSARYGDRWSDSTALEAAFLHGLTRFSDPGRGQGLQQIRKQVRKWSGLISVRSGTARISQVPEWDDSPPMVDGMASLPGAQIGIILPAAVQA